MRVYKLIFCAFLLCGSLSGHAAQRWIDMNWEPLEQAQSYEIELYKWDAVKDESNLVVTEKTLEARWSRQVSAGRYKFRLRALDRRGVPGAWSEMSLIDVRYEKPVYVHPLVDEILKGLELEQETVSFQWRRMEGVNFYFVEIWNNDGFEKQEFVQSNEFQVTLPVAQKYKWRVVALDSKDDAIADREGEGTQFTLEGGGVKPVKLRSSKEGNELVFNWKTPELAKSFDVRLYKKAINSKWLTEFKAEEYQKQRFPISLRAPGMYRLAVTAKAPLRRESLVAYAEFRISENETFDIGTVRVQEGRDLSDSNPFFYSVGVEYIGLDYEGLSRERDTGVSTRIAGQRFFLEGSYQSFYSPWKHRVSLYYQRLNNLDLKKNLIEANYLIGRPRQWKSIPYEINFGIFFKEDLFVKADVFTGDLEFQKVSNLGPFVRFNLNYRVSRYFEIGAEAKAYFHAFALGTPNDEELAKTLSYSLQASVTYHSSEEKTYTVFAGLYSSEIRYEATAGDSTSSSSQSIAVPGTENEANTTGTSVGIRMNSFF